MRRPVVGIALAFAAGVAGSLWLKAWPALAAAIVLVAWAILIGSVAGLAGRAGSAACNRVREAAMACALWFAVGIAAAAYTLARVDQDAVSLAAWVGQDVMLTGVVDGEPDAGEGRAAYLVRVEKINERPARGRVRLADYRRGQRRFHAGDRIRAPVTLRRPQPAANPGEFDSAAHLARQGIYFEAALAPGGRIAYAGSEARGVAAVAVGAREALEAALRRVLPAEPAALASGLLFGSRAALQESLIADFRAAGILHLLAVSGGNVAFIAMPALIAFRRFGLARNAAFLGTGLVVAAFVLLTGATPSVVRAGVMACTALLGATVGRRGDALAALAAAGVLQMLWQPLVLFDAGFQLSFAATAGILAFARRWSEPVARLARAGQEGPNGALALARVGVRSLLAAAGSAAAVTLAAQVGVLPVQAHYFGSVSLAALPANLVALPLVAALVPVAAAACIAGLVLPALAAPFAATIELLVGALTSAAHLAARLPFAEMVVAPPAPGTIVAYTLACLYFAGWWQPPGLPPAAAWRPRHFGIAALAIAVAATWSVALRPRNILEIVFLARHGEVVFVRFPGGATALVDGRPYRAAPDAFEGLAGPEETDEALQPFLRRQGVAMPDLVLRTSGGLRASGEPPRPGPNLSPDPAVGLWPLRRVEDGDEGGTVPLLLQHGDVSIVLGGRGGEADEDAILSALVGRRQTLTVLRVARDGVRPTSDAFLTALWPSWIIVQAVGTGSNRAVDTMLQRLNDLGARVVRTDLAGAVTVRSDGKAILIEEYHQNSATAEPARNSATAETGAKSGGRGGDPDDNVAERHDPLRDLRPELQLGRATGGARAAGRGGAAREGTYRRGHAGEAPRLHLRPVRGEGALRG